MPKERASSGIKLNAINRFVESDLIRRVSYDQYREKVRDVYRGPRGALLSTLSVLSMHVPLGERIFRTRVFDLAGARRILDVGSGAGQIASHLLKYSDADAEITCSDLSQDMLDRAKKRLNSERPQFVAADLTDLPFDDESFDCVTCGYVLEHLPDPHDGLAEVARVLEPGGRMFLLTTEANFAGAWTSRIWHCRTYNRKELREVCESLGLMWKEEIWLSKLHHLLRAGGIGVEIEKA